jgi:hypothetical protein
MVEADPVMRAARNGFLVLIVVLLGLSVYRFWFVEKGGMTIPALWTLGVVVYYGSKLYYERYEESPTGE